MINKENEMLKELKKHIDKMENEIEFEKFMKHKDYVENNIKCSNCNKIGLVHCNPFGYEFLCSNCGDIITIEDK